MFRGAPGNRPFFKAYNPAARPLPAISHQAAIAATEVQPLRRLIEWHQRLNRAQNAAPLINPNRLVGMLEFEDIVHPRVCAAPDEVIFGIDLRIVGQGIGDETETARRTVAKVKFLPAKPALHAADRRRLRATDLTGNHIPPPAPRSAILTPDQIAAMQGLSDLRVKLFADGADRAEIARACANPMIRGFTTNPTLMRAAGVKDYERFAREILELVPDRPVSLEVLADEFREMERQAVAISSWAQNVYVKIPVTNTRRESSLDLICRLAHSGIQVNVTAVMTLDQVRDAAAVLGGGAPASISVFAGRIADTGRDPVPLMAAAVELLGIYPNIELIWASPRELLNVFQADAVGCHIITLTGGLLSKLGLVGKDLSDYSLETVRMFYDDAVKSGYRL